MPVSTSATSPHLISPRVTPPYFLGFDSRFDFNSGSSSTSGNNEKNIEILKTTAGAVIVTFTVTSAVAGVRQTETKLYKNTTTVAPLTNKIKML